MRTSRFNAHVLGKASLITGSDLFSSEGLEYYRPSRLRGRDGNVRLEDSLLFFFLGRAVGEAFP